MVQWNILYSAYGAAQKVSPGLEDLIEQKKEEAAARGGSLLQRSDRIGGSDGVSNIVRDIIKSGDDPEAVFLKARAFIACQEIDSKEEKNRKEELEVVGRRWK